MTRLRVRFSKLGKVRFTSHRDLARIWERALRRAEVPVARTEGFTPRPKVSFGLALPTGAESLAEYLDVELSPDGSADLEALPARLSGALPVGIDVTAAVPLAAGAASLQSDVTSCEWEAALPGSDPAGLAARIDEVLASPSVVANLERKGKQVEVDLRPAILSLAALPPVGGAARLRVELANGAETGGRSVRPGEVVLALVPGLESVRLRRTAQWIERDGSRIEPLPAPPALVERAS